MPYGTPPLARQPEHGRFNRFLASLPPHDFRGWRRICAPSRSNAA